MGKSVKLQNDIYIDGSTIYPKLNYSNDTAADSFQNLLKNKLDWCIQYIKIPIPGMTFINGGWQGIMFGFGVYSKINAYTYQLVWFSASYIGYVMKYNSNYTYKKVDFSNI